MLIVVRTITTVAYLFDAIPDLLSDRRIQTLFTLNGDNSAYVAGVEEAVRDLGGRLVPWEQAVATKFDLAISASHYGGLDELRSPLLILSHGTGFTKKISRPDDGLAPQPELDGPEPRARTTVILSHEEQRHQWHEDRDGLTQATVAGDPVFDRLEASLPHRDRYRRALGVGEEQKLIAISSTWGPLALLATHPTLPSDLVAELPFDEYAVLTLLHANIWVGHGRWQLRLWMGRAMQGGLRLVPHDDGSWRTALAASDLLIGDHGSVTFYGATLGIPTVLGAFGEEEMVSGTPLAGLGAIAPRVDWSRPLRPQLEEIGFDLDRGRYADLADRSYANRGRALEELRATVYRLIDLDLPGEPIWVAPAPAPAAETQPVRALLVVATLEDADRHAPRVSVSRFPAALEPEQAAELAGRHLLVLSGEKNPSLWQNAGVIAHTPEEGAPLTEAEAIGWTTEMLRAYPGCRVAAAAVEADSCVIALRDDRLLRAKLANWGDAGLVASAIYAWSTQAPSPAQPPEKISVGCGRKILSATLSAVPLRTELGPT